MSPKVVVFKAKLQKYVFPAATKVLDFLLVRSCKKVPATPEEDADGSAHKELPAETNLRDELIGILHRIQQSPLITNTKETVIEAVNSKDFKEMLHDIIQQDLKPVVANIKASLLNDTVLNNVNKLNEYVNDVNKLSRNRGSIQAMSIADNDHTYSIKNTHESDFSHSLGLSNMCGDNEASAPFDHRLTDRHQNSFPVSNLAAAIDDAVRRSLDARMNEMKASAATVNAGDAQLDSITPENCQRGLYKQEKETIFTSNNTPVDKTRDLKPCNDCCSNYKHGVVAPSCDGNQNVRTGASPTSNTTQSDNQSLSGPIPTTNGLSPAEVKCLVAETISQLRYGESLAGYANADFDTAHNNARAWRPEAVNSNQILASPYPQNSGFFPGAVPLILNQPQPVGREVISAVLQILPALARVLEMKVQQNLLQPRSKDSQQPDDPFKLRSALDSKAEENFNACVYEYLMDEKPSNFNPSKPRKSHDRNVVIKIRRE